MRPLFQFFALFKTDFSRTSCDTPDWTGGALALAADGASRRVKKLRAATSLADFQKKKNRLRLEEGRRRI
jgi:hypothetical protein